MQSNIRPLPISDGEWDWLVQIHPGLRLNGAPPNRETKALRQEAPATPPSRGLLGLGKAERNYEEPLPGGTKRSNYL